MSQGQPNRDPAGTISQDEMLTLEQGYVGQKIPEELLQAAST